MSELLPSISPLISSLPFRKNNYQFLSVIGSGGSSVVFKVQSFNYRSTFFAAKVTPKTNESRLLDLNALKSLSHSYIISVYDFFEDEQNYYIILEYCQNGSLSSLIKVGQINTKDDMLFFMKKLSSAIFFCHSKGIAHRDIKPSNVLLDTYGRPKLIDFGICEMLYTNNNVDSNLREDDGGYYLAKKSGQIKLIRKFYGSPPYLAPEIVLKEPYDPFSADVWSLGVTFYEIATGSLPWNPHSGKMEDAICQSSLLFPNSTPSIIQKLIKTMMQVDPKKRPTMRSIANCSLFETNIPSSLKLFTSSSAFFNINATEDQPEEMSQGSSGKKLRKSSNCVTFSNYESFMNNKSCSQQIATSSLVFKQTNPTIKRRRTCVRPSNNITLKAYSSSPFRSSKNRLPFISSE